MNFEMLNVLNNIPCVENSKISVFQYVSLHYFTIKFLTIILYCSIIINYDCTSFET